MIVPTLTFIYDRRGRAKRGVSAPVELRIYVDGKQKYVNTGIKLLPKEWSKGGFVSACRDDYMELNEQLHIIKQKATSVITAMIKQGEIDINALPSILQDELKQTGTFVSYITRSTQRKYPTIAEGTRKRYDVFLRFINKWKGIVYFSDISERKIMDMDRVLSGMGQKESTRWNYHKLLKMFIDEAINDGLIKRNPYAKLNIKRGDEDGLKRCLTPAEFHRFESCNIDIDKLRRVRDLFIFQAYTMMSYSDLAEFSYDKCEEVSGQVIYKNKRIKTRQSFISVLVKPAMNILQRYNYKLPIISNVKYNEYLKVAVLCAGINKPVTTHWARHTGATIMINEYKLPMHIVQHLLGHASIRETEKTYAKVLDSTIVEAVGMGQ
ncbi:MAG: site-specific integrase [Prevotella sp.]|nr:site-specific integrase [Prevotella sp.]